MSKMNSLFHDVTEAVGEVQLLGAAKWSAAGKPYPIRCVVYHKDKAWQSKVVNNNIEPVAGAAWAELKADATAGDVGAYSKTEADTKYQPKGNYQVAGDFATKAELKTGLDGKLNTSIIKQTPGTSTTDIMSQKTVTDELSKKQNSGDFATNAALKGGLDKKLDKTGGITTGGITSTSISVHESSSTPKLNIYSARGASTLAFFQYNDGPNWYGKLNIPRVELGKTETLMKVGEFGIGSSGLPQYANMGAAVDYKTGFYGISGTDPRKIPGDGASNIVQVGAGDYFWQIGKTTLNDIVYFRSVKASKLGSWIKIWSESNTTTDRNGHLKASGSAELSDYPPGAPIPWPQATAPAGFLVCNGQSFNKSTYPLLTKAYPSGVLPDLRGEFIRGLDAGRNIDENRDVLTAQGDAIRNITGEFSNNGNAKDSAADSNPTGAFMITKRNITSNLERNSDGVRYALDASLVVPTANENRPRNIAFLYIVRAA